MILLKPAWKLLLRKAYNTGLKHRLNKKRKASSTERSKFNFESASSAGFRTKTVKKNTVGAKQTKNPAVAKINVITSFFFSDVLLSPFATESEQIALVKYRPLIKDP